MVYDWRDENDVLQAAQELRKIMKTEGWNVLQQRAEVLRQEAAAQALDKNEEIAEIRGRIEGVFKLLEDAETLIRQGAKVVDDGKQRAAARGQFDAGQSPL
jgi:hypothetical protein